MSKIERSVEELYRDDPERADAVVFGRAVKSVADAPLAPAPAVVMSRTEATPETLPAVSDFVLRKIPASA